MREVDIWLARLRRLERLRPLERLRRFWSQRLDALAAELARGKRQRRAHRDGAGPERRQETDST